MADLERRVIIIVYNDGHQERHRLTPSLEMEFERLYGAGIGKAFVGDQASTNLTRLAWLAVSRAPRNGSVLKTIEGGWADDLDVVSVDTERIAPFVAGQEGVTSQNSASQLESLPAS